MVFDARSEHTLGMLQARRCTPVLGIALMCAASCRGERPAPRSWTEVGQHLDVCIDRESIDDDLVRIRVAADGTVNVVDGCYSRDHDSDCIRRAIESAPLSEEVAGERTVAISRRELMSDQMFRPTTVRGRHWGVGGMLVLSTRCNLTSTWGPDLDGGVPLSGG